MKRSYLPTRTFSAGRRFCLQEATLERDQQGSPDLVPAGGPTPLVRSTQTTASDPIFLKGLRGRNGTRWCVLPRQGCTLMIACVEGPLRAGTCWTYWQNLSAR